jgi:hypothetical protein
VQFQTLQFPYLEKSRLRRFFLDIGFVSGGKKRGFCPPGVARGYARAVSACA